MREGAIHSMKAVAALLLACVLACSALAWSAPAHAASYGSIGLTCTVDRGGSKVPLAGDGYALTKVASATVDPASASVAYATEDAFKGIDRDWAALDAAGLRAMGREVAAYAEKQGIDPLRTARSDASGHVTFGSLETGLYLIVRYDLAPANKGFACDPVLVSVPTKVGGTLDFTVEATPKFEEDKPTPGPDPDKPVDPDRPIEPDPDKPVDPDAPVGPDAPDPENPDQPVGPGGQGGSGGQGDGPSSGGALGQLADKVAGALGFAKTSDGMMTLACAAAACAFVAAGVVVWRRRAAAVPRGAHAVGAKRPARDGAADRVEASAEGDSVDDAPRNDE